MKTAVEWNTVERERAKERERKRNTENNFYDPTRDDGVFVHIQNEQNIQIFRFELKLLSGDFIQPPRKRQRESDTAREKRMKRSNEKPDMM